MTDLKGRIALITGASSGIGEACAHVFAAAGMKLILAARRLDRLESLAESLASTHGERPCLLQVDVRDMGIVTRIIEDLPPAWSSIDLLINSAGLARGRESAAAGDARDWDEMVDTNIKGLLYVTRAVLPGMLERQRGHVINIGSTAGRDVYPGGAVYAATKAAVEVISKGIRMDVVGTPIRVTNVEPGMTETEFSLVRFHGDAAQADKVYEGVTPLTARDIAEAILFVATRPPHVNIDMIMLRPVAQASSALLARKPV